MALLIDYIEAQTQTTCRKRFVGCYHGQEAIVLRQLEKYSHQPDCWTEVFSAGTLADLGWKRRLGRLPICPAHQQPSDDPYPP